MLAVPNGCASDMISNKLPLENGRVLKYKPRKVSAVREFPLGCGPILVPIDSNSEESGAAGFGTLEGICAGSSQVTNDVVGNDNLIPKVADLMYSNEGRSSELTNKMEAEDLKVTSKMENGVGSEIACQPHKAANSPVNEDITGSLDVLVEKVVADANSSKKSVGEVGRHENQLPSEVESQTREANPVIEQRARSSDALVGKVTAMEIDGFPDGIDELMTDNEVVELMRLDDIKSNISKEDAETGGETKVDESDKMEILSLDLNSGEEVSNLDVSVGKEIITGIPQSSSATSDFVKPDTSSRPKEKYKKRRVSAVRDFPLKCGPNVPLPIEENNMILTSENDCFNNSEQDKVKSVIAMQKNGSAGDPPPTDMAMTSPNVLDGFDQIHLEQESTDEHVEDPRCDSIKKTEATVVEPGSVPETKKVMDSSVDDVREPVRESVSQSLNRDDKDRSQHKHVGSGLTNQMYREVIHGLMAAPKCPFRKAKASINNLDGTSSGSKVRLKSLSQQKKSKTVAPRSVIEEDFSGGPSMERTTSLDFHIADAIPISAIHMDEEHYGTCEQHPLAIVPLSVYQPVPDDCDDDFKEPVKKDIAVASHGKAGTSRVKERKKSLSWRQKGKFVARKSKPKSVPEFNTSHDAGKNSGALVPVNDECFHDEVAYSKPSSSQRKPQNIDVSLPPFGSTTSGHSDARHKVRETLRLFNAICRKLLQREEAEEEGISFKSKKGPTRIDLMTAKIIKERKKEVNTEEQILGAVPGVEVGDEFQYRVELALVGIHRLYQAGIDWMKYNGVPVATSIVASGAYEDDFENADELHYCGSGGNIVGKVKTPKDQKLERGNLALNNSIKKGTPVRVIRGWKETKVVDPSDTRPKIVTTYVYDGLYTVVECSIKERSGHKIFMFKLVRHPGQPELAWKELKKTNRPKIRPGTCINDISQGQEKFAISAVNTLNNEKPPLFRYTSKMMYPKWLKLNHPSGCSCTGRCSDSKRCRCAAKNGGEIPYNHNGAIVESKPIVYECGPHCKCPPSCYNRVSQGGIRFQLEIFKTESRGWGVRPLTSIPSGSFICEYAGELLQDKEAEERIGNDEYLFDIGHNYQENTLNPQEQANLAEEGGYTIDAAQYGNVGRFINHSCSPNLYAQYVIYDHDDKKMPHVMLFAMENIPPLQELTYHYNYSVDQVRDIDGNIKVKKCYCGSAECNGRLY